MVCACTFVLSALAAKSTQSEGAVTDYVAAQSKRVSVHASVVSLDSFCRLISKQTGLEVSAARAFGSRKVTAFFRDRPLSEVMWATGSALQVDWQRVPGGYRVGLTDRARAGERRLVALEQAAAASQLERCLRELARMSDTPRAKLIERLRKGESVTGGAVSPANERAMIPWSELGRSVAGKESDLARTMLSGQTVFASTLPRRGALAAPAGFLTEGYLRSNGDGTYERPTNSLVALRYSPVSNVLQGRGFLMGFGNSAQGTIPLNVDLSEETNRKPNADEFYKELTAWGASVDPSLLAKKVNPDASGKLAPKAHCVPFQTVADELERISDVTGVPVIADAFRIPCTRDPLNGRTISEWLSAINTDRDKPANGFVYRKGYVRTEKGWLMYRHAGYWRLVSREVPEEALVPLETAYAKRPLSLDEYANFANRLTDAQMDGFSDARSVVADFPPSPIGQGGEFLALWGRLSPAERRAALTNEGLPIGALRGDRARDVKWLANRLLWTKSLQERILKYLLPGNEALPPLFLFCAPAKIEPDENDKGALSRPGSSEADYFTLSVDQLPEHGFSVAIIRP